MATERKFYLDNKLIEPPKNGEETTIKFSFDKDRATNVPVLGITNFNLVRENGQAIMQWYKDGNIFNGLPFRYEIERNGIVEKIFDGYFDMADGAKLNEEPFIDPGVELTAKLREKLDWLNDTADSITFDYLAAIGKITSANYIWMPYVISTIPNYTSSIITLSTIAVITIQLSDQLNELSKELARLVNIFAFTTLIEVVLHVIFVVALLITLVLLIQDLFRYIIQPTKYHACMKAVDLLTIGAAAFGYTFKSDIFKAPFDNLVIMPEKYYIAPDVNEKHLLGFLTPLSTTQIGYPKKTIGDFFREIKKTFKAKILINDNKEFILIPEWQQSGAPQYQLPDIYQPEFTTNATDLNSNYAIEFLTDINDKNTLQEYKGTAIQVITSQNPALSDPFLNCLKKAELEQIPFALAKRKSELTLPEEALKAFFDVYDVIMGAMIDVVNVFISIGQAIADAINSMIDLFNDITDFCQLDSLHIDFQVGVPQQLNKADFQVDIENRIGMLKLENDFVNVQKMFLIEQGSKPEFNKIPDNNNTMVSARNFYNLFHGPAHSFLPSNARPNGNQYIIKEFKNVPFTFADFLKIRNDNIIFTANGIQAEIIDGEWFDYEEKANLKVRISTLYTTKLIETIIEPDGA